MLVDVVTWVAHNHPKPQTLTLSPPPFPSLPAESEVRSSVAFQVSKLASLMSKALRIAAGQSAWDGLVTGACDKR